MTDEPQPPRQRRADATFNRQSILDYAHTALTSGEEWSLNSIARGAGVGNATLYRHFPNRQSLILEVYAMEVDRVVDSADRLLHEHPADRALEEWVAELARYAMTKHGFAEALQAATAPGSAMFDDTYDRIVAALARLLEAASAAGAIRPGLDPNDVILALAGLWQLDPDSNWEQRATRLYRLVLRGLATDQN